MVFALSRNGMERCHTQSCEIADLLGEVRNWLIELRRGPYWENIGLKRKGRNEKKKKEKLGRQRAWASLNYRGH